MDGLASLPDDEGEADDDSPLIYPCKCSGSVRYVHADCLRSWLQHSQKRHCEICGHSYTFTKVYPSSIPTVIPTLVYIRQSFFAVEHGLLRLLRIAAVIWAWLIALPSCNMLSMRIFLAFGDWVLKSSLEAVYANNATKINETLITVYGNLSEPIVAPVTGNEPHGQAASLLLDALKNLYVQTFLSVVNVIFHPFKLGFALGEGLYRVLLLVENERTITNVLRGQVLSLVLAALMIGIVILRDYMQQHAWTAPAQQDEQEPIDPDEWMVRRGVAFRLPWRVPGRPPRPVPRLTAEQWQQRRDVANGEDDVPPPAARAGDLVYAGDHVDLDPSLAQLDNTLPPRRPADMHLALPPYDAAAPPARPSAQTPNNDVAFAAPEMLVESSSRRHIFWDDNDEERASPDVPHDVATQLAPARASSSSPTTSLLAALADEELEHIRAGSSREATVDRVENDFDLEPPSPAYLSQAPEWDIKAVSPAHVPVHHVFKDEPSEPAPPLAQPSESPELADRRSESSSAAVHTDLGADTIATESIEDQLRSIRRELAERERKWMATVQRDEPPEAARDEEPFASTAVEPVRQDAQLNEAAEADALVLPDPIAPVEEAGLLGVVAQRGLDRVDGLVRDDGEDAEGDEDADLVDHIVDQPAPGAQDFDDGFLDQDDWAGILEVVGLLGPMSAMFQNVCFAIIIMSGCIGVGVGLPCAIGKFVLSTDSVRFMLQVLSLLGVAVRYLIEPTAQVLYEILHDVVFAPLAGVLGSSVSTTASDWPIFERVAGFDLSAPIETPANATAVERVVLAVSGTSLDALAWLGSKSFDAYQAYRVFAIDLAASRALKDQMACVAVGYAVVGSLVLALLFAGETGLMALPDSWLKNLRQYTKFAKLAFFMVLEILCFPVGAGLLIGMSTAPLLFDSATKGPVDMLRRLPIGTIFIAWIIGTVFMFAFSTAISYIRSISRPGALFFIRDPQDESFSPVKDILEKSATSQMRKLTTSFVMYAVLIFCLFGAVPWLFCLVPATGVVPLRLSLPPISSVPFDLLFLHLGVPPLWASLRLQDRSKSKFRSYYRSTVRAFNLSSLLLPASRRFTFEKIQVSADSDGNLTANVMRKAALEDPVHAVLDKAFAVVDRTYQLVFGKYDASATLVRVPARDTVVLLAPAERRGIFIRLDEAGRPRTPEDKLQLLKQDRAAREAKREPITDYQLVTLPAHWKTRVHALIVASVAAVSIAIAALALGPLVVGRMALALLTPEPLHDGYSLLAGIGICWLSHALASAARRQIRTLRFAACNYRRGTSARVKGRILAFLRRAYAFVLLYGALPLLVGLNWEVYMAVPARYGLRRAVPVLHVGDAWAMGLALVSAFVGGSTWTRMHRGEAALSTRLRRAFRKPQDQTFTAVNRLVLPMLSMLLVPIAAPWAGAALGIKALDMAGVAFDDAVNALAFRLTYPLTSTVFLVFCSRHAIADYLGKARQSMVDAEYVVEERVENYEPGRTVGSAPSVAAATAGSDDEGEDGEDVEEMEDVEDVDGDDAEEAGDSGDVDDSMLSEGADEASERGGDDDGDGARDGHGYGHGHGHGHGAGEDEVAGDLPVLGDEQEVIVFR